MLIENTNNLEKTPQLVSASSFFAQFIFCFKIVSHPIELNFCQIGLMNAFRGIQRYGHREIEVLNLMEVYYYTSAQRKNGWITTSVLPFM